VDDDPEFSDLAAEFLERQDDRFVVETASDAAAGRDRLDDDIDCVVSDYEMPGMDGIEFLTAVREAYPDLPFILFTGKGSEEVASDAISADVTDYLRKGSGTDQYELLANRITNAVSQVRAEQQLEAERRRFQALFENLSQGVVEVEWEGDTPVVQQVNPGFTEVFGYDADEVVGESLDEYVVPEAEVEDLQRLNRRIRSKESLYSEEVTRVTADGPRRFLLQTATYGDGSGAFAVYTDITERKRREREVERQNRRLRALFENFPEPTIAYTFRDGGPYVMDVNTAFARRFGRDAEAATGERVDELLVPPERREAAQRLSDRVKAGELIDEEVHRRAPDGIGDFRLRNIPIPDDDCIDGYCVYADITAYKRRERELERQNDLFRKAQAMADIGAWEYDIVDDEFLWSEQMYEIHGHPTDSEPTIEEAIGDYHPEDRSTVREALTGAIERGEPYDVEARIRTPEGDCRWVRARGDPQTEDGSRVRVRGTVQNITEHRDRERALQRERDRYQSLFENNPLIIWEEDFSEAVAYLEEITAGVDDVETYLREHPEEITELRERVEIIDVNQNAVEYYDAPSKEVLIDNVEELFGAGAIEAMAAEWAGIADGRTRFRNEVVSHTLSGEEHRELVDMFVPEDSADDYSRVYVIGTDITEQKQRERELKRQNERLDEFASVVSHDLRSPLSVAAGRLELAATECDSDHIDAVADAHDRMEALIDDLLELARQGHPVGETEPVDLETTLGRCWETVETGEASLRVDIDRPIQADPSRLRQLLENLYRNSVEHGSTGSRTKSDDAVEHGATGNRAKPGDSVEHAGPGVTVTVGTLEGGFYVEDDGPGIPEDERENVFEAGYSTAGDGTGFGLSIVKEVAEAHGWTVAATEGSDGGARFEFTGVSFAD
jgi:PAS domain S-box-containing protein